MSLSAAADELYGVPPGDFTATRRRLADGLPRDEARRLTAMRRPTVSAWAVNLLVRDGVTGHLLELGQRMRAAWESGQDVGALEGERSALVEDLVGRARGLAAAAGRPLSDAFAGEVEDTLRAAIADPAAADAVRAGRLERPLRHAGFGPLGAVGAVARQPRRKHTSEEEPKLRQRRLAEAALRAERAEESLAEWAAELAAAQERLAAAERRIAELREQLDEAERQRADLDRRARVSQREHDRAARTAADARRRAVEA